MDYEYEDEHTPVTVNSIKEVINLGLEYKTLRMDFMQAITDWLAVQEQLILSEYAFDLCERKIHFMGIDGRLRSAGHCKTVNIKPIAEIYLSKWLFVPGNAYGIVNVLAHEVLHAILPFGEKHGMKFKAALSILNRRLGLQMRVVGIVSKVKYGPLKYEVYCPHCNKVLRRYFRKGKCVKNIKDFKHLACGTTLKVRCL